MRKPKSSLILDKRNLKVTKEEVVPEESVVAIDQIPEKELSTGEESYIQVTQTILGRPKEEVKTIKIRPFVTTPARVEVHAKRHVPLGPNEGNITVAVTISMPCYREEIVSTYKQVDEIVDKLMQRKLKEMGLAQDGN